jgi:hypothetical protein
MPPVLGSAYSRAMATSWDWRLGWTGTSVPRRNRARWSGSSSSSGLLEGRWVGGMTWRRCREGGDALDGVEVAREVAECAPGERSGYGEGDEGGFGVDTPSAFASLASLAGAMGVRARGVPRGAEEQSESGFGPAGDASVLDAVAVAVAVAAVAGSCAFVVGSKLFRKAKEGTGAAVVQDILV